MGRLGRPTPEARSLTLEAPALRWLSRVYSRRRGLLSGSQRVRLSAYSFSERPCARAGGTDKPLDSPYLCLLTGGAGGGSGGAPATRLEPVTTWLPRTASVPSVALASLTGWPAARNWRGERAASL